MGVQGSPPAGGSMRTAGGPPALLRAHCPPLGRLPPRPAPQPKASAHPEARGPRAPPPTGPGRATLASSVCVTRRSSLPRPRRAALPSLPPAPPGRSVRAAGGHPAPRPLPLEERPLAGSARTAARPATCAPAACGHRRARTAASAPASAGAKGTAAEDEDEDEDGGGAPEPDSGAGRGEERGGGCTWRAGPGLNGRAHRGRDEVLWPRSGVRRPRGSAQTLRATVLLQNRPQRRFGERAWSSRMGGGGRVADKSGRSKSEGARLVPRAVCVGGGGGGAGAGNMEKGDYRGPQVCGH